MGFVMARGFEELDVYRLSEKLADHVWDLVKVWDAFAKFALGSQLVRAADSVGSNIAEGSGRGTFKDNCHFARIGRGSLYETRHHLRRAFRRGLLTQKQVADIQPLVQELGPRLNAYIKMLSNRASQQKASERTNNK
jgi:four helix bundle protein